MTDITNPSFNREVSSYELGTVVRKGAASDGYIQPSNQPTLAAQETVISQGNFNEFAETHSSSSFDVTIDAGEAFVHGSWLARDTSTTVTLSSSTSNQSVYAGIDKSLANTVIIGKSGAFASLDPKIELYSFDTDSNGVTSVSDSRQIGHKIDVDAVNSTSVSTEKAVSDEGIIADRLKHRAIANSIRATSGLPSGVTIGPRNSTGLSNSGALGSATSLTVTAESDISGIASSGSGTESDPYIVADKDYSSGGVEFNDSDGSYAVTFQNCEIGGSGSSFDGSLFINAFDKATLRFENCLIYGDNANTVAAVAFRSDGPTVELKDSEIAGGEWGVRFYQNTSLKARDVTFSDAQSSYNKEIIDTGNDLPNADIDLQFIDVSPSTRTSFYGASGEAGDVELTNITANNLNHFITTGSGTPKSLEIGYFDVSDCNNNPIEANGGVLSDFEIHHGDMTDFGASGVRGIHLSSASHRNGEIHHLYLNTPNAPSDAGEHIHLVESQEIEVHHCWSENCEDDPFEEGLGGGAGNHYHHLVADNAGAALVDIYTASPGSNGHDSGAHVHHIYGDTDGRKQRGIGVAVTDCNFVTIHNVVVSAPIAAVELIQDGANAGQAPDNCNVFDVLSLSETTTPYSENGDVGSNNRVVYLDGETTQDPYGVGSPWTDIR